MTSKDHKPANPFNLPPDYNPMTMLRQFLKLEAAGGLILLFCAVIAMVIANSPLYHFYHSFLHETKAVIGVENLLLLEKDIIHWINDGLMAIFFFVVGLEIKREVKEGLLSSKDQIVLPIVAAIGGMAIPGVIFFMLNKDNPAALSGWAIPTATDIAFAVGILSLLGRKVPISLKVFLLALAIIDDLGAIVIIALFYTQNLDVMQLAFAGVFIAGLFTLNRCGVSKGTLYLLLGVGLWICVLKSGIHATLAGVITAFAIPLQIKGERRSLLRQLEHDLHGAVAFIVLPLFAFANAGVSLEGVSLNAMFDSVTLGVILGLFVGKQVGIFGAAWLCIKSGLVAMPKGATWGRIWGVSLLAGIGFTMSLFIATLGYIGKPEYLTEAKLGILSGSLLAALVGLGVMWFTCRHYQPEPVKNVATTPKRKKVARKPAAGSKAKGSAKKRAFSPARA